MSTYNKGRRQREIIEMKHKIDKNVKKITALEREIDELKKQPDDGYDTMPVEIFNDKIRTKSPVSIADIKRIHSIKNGGSIFKKNRRQKGGRIISKEELIHNIKKPRLVSIVLDQDEALELELLNKKKEGTNKAVFHNILFDPMNGYNTREGFTKKQLKGIGGPVFKIIFKKVNGESGEAVYLYDSEYGLNNLIYVSKIGETALPQGGKRKSRTKRKRGYRGKSHKRTKKRRKKKTKKRKKRN